MLNNIEKVIREYIPEVIHLSLATCANNKPWVCEVHFAYDNELNLYFVSLPNTRHSGEIRANPFVSGNIVKQFGLGEKPRGVYFEGTAKELGIVDKYDPAFITYDKRYDIGTPDGHHFYKITVDTFYVFDRIESEGEKYELKWKK